ncbi:MAG: RsmB/NOP family class I SAM-dependent RNA methyltransferase [Cypionkella sp.]
MTPEARLSAAIEVLDRILAGQPAEAALTQWGRASRFAGSGDRHGVRDLVFEALRRKRSFAALGGAETGRGLILGGLRAQGIDPAGMFTGQGHAPAPLRAAEAARETTLAERLDCPDWLLPVLQASLAADFVPVMQALQQRAPVFLRVNSRKGDVAAAQAALAAQGVATELTSLASFGLEVTGGARKIQSSEAYKSGLVELQDAASQAVIEALPLADGQRVLDYCCGGDGKTLAMAARAKIALSCHDAEPRRMRDLPARAERAGVEVNFVENPSKAMPYDLILTDVPCSGSGSWRRDPQGKWALTPERLAQLQIIQAQILDEAAALLAQGVLAYATCSMLLEENEQQIAALLARHPAWHCSLQRRFSPLSGADGFFLAVLTRQG